MKSIPLSSLFLILAIQSVRSTLSSLQVIHKIADQLEGSQCVKFISALHTPIDKDPKFDDLEKFQKAGIGYRNCHDAIVDWAKSTSSETETEIIMQWRLERLGRGDLAELVQKYSVKKFTKRTLPDFFEAYPDDEENNEVLISKETDSELSKRLELYRQLRIYVIVIFIISLIAFITLMMYQPKNGGQDENKGLISSRKQEEDVELQKRFSDVYRQVISDVYTQNKIQ